VEADAAAGNDGGQGGSIEVCSAAISIEDIWDAEEERAVASFREFLAAHGLLPDKHDDYHMVSVLFGWVVKCLDLKLTV
jgi:hypothetical protein